jgi:tetratricopeptide (TPR) repeat protein
MSRPSVEFSASEPESKANTQTILRKKGRRRRLALAGVLAIVVGTALWSVIRVEGVPEGDSEVDAQHKLGTSQKRLGKTDDAITTVYPNGGPARGEDDAHFSLGMASPDHDDLDKAIADCCATIRLRPDDADAQAKYGALLIVQGKLDLAIAALREATHLKPGRSDAHCKLGRALNAQGKVDEAVAELRETIRLEPGNVDAHQFLGEALARQGRIDDATEQFLEANRLKYDPNFALTSLKAHDEGASNLASSMAEKHELDAGPPAPLPRSDSVLDETGANDDRATRITTGPQSAAGFYNRSIELAQAKEYDKALSDLNTAIRLDSSFAAAYVVRGEIWLKTDELDKAIADLNEAVRVDPHGRAFNVRGFAWARKRKFVKAIDDYSEAIRLDPEDATAYYGRGCAWAAKQEYEKSIVDFDSAIRNDALFAGAYIGRGSAWNSQKLYDQAIVDFGNAIRLDPKGAGAYTGRGYAWSQKNEYEKAIADYNEANRLAPDDAGALNGRAWLASTCSDAKYRDGKQAVELATRACELTKWNQPMILDTLAAAFAESGDYEAARKWQAKAIELLTDDKEMGDFRRRLELYQQKRPYRN